MSGTFRAYIAACLFPLAFCVCAEDKPDFSGTWTLNVSKSDFGGPNNVLLSGHTMLIEQNGDIITMKVIGSAVLTPSAVQEQKQQAQHLSGRMKKFEEELAKERAKQSDTTTYKADGSETKFQSFGQDAAKSVTWEGNTLVTKTSIYNGKHAVVSRVTDTWALSPDGNVLTETTHGSSHVAFSSDFETNTKMVFERQCDAVTTGPKTDLHDAILAVVQAAAEPDPFASIRGEFDLSGSDNHQWKTSLKLPNAEKCSLIKLPSTVPAAAPVWTFACTFRVACNGYEGMVKSLQAVLQLPYQPDEGASRSQVFFADPSKPIWRSFVTRINDARVGIWFVATRPAAGPSPVLPQAEQVFPGLTTLRPGRETGAAGSTSSIAAEVDAIGRGPHNPFPSLHTGSGSAPTTNGMIVLAIKNDTPYMLTVLFSGPTERRVDVPAGGSVPVEVRPGAYRLAGRVDAANVRPSYSEDNVTPSTSGVEFYIQH